MDTLPTPQTRNLKVSQMAETLIGSEILKLAAEINAKIKSGEKVYNMTVGDFNPKIFPIPELLKDEIITAYNDDETNYPPASGISELVISVSQFLSKYEGLEYSTDEILIAGGARPLIYSTFMAILDPHDTVLYPVPSWNNNHYCHLSSCNQIAIETKPENNFMPTVAELRPHIEKAQLLALCSPLNPTGTAFTKQGLSEICELVLEENARRGSDEKPLYLMYDQMYWVLTHGKTEHVNPVSLIPELKNYTIFIDGISKAFAATGIRLGWGFGPKKVIDKMKSIVGHIGAWAPKPEQVATAKFLKQDEAIGLYLSEFKHEISVRLEKLFKGFMTLKSEGFPVDAIAPQAAIYLTVQFNIKGKLTVGGNVIGSTSDITAYILNEAKVGLVPFSAFGASMDSTWYRISVGTAKLEDIEQLIINLRDALKKLI